MALLKLPSLLEPTCVIHQLHTFVPCLLESCKLFTLTGLYYITMIDSAGHISVNRIAQMIYDPFTG